MQTQGQTVLITGGTGGIGRALAARFLAAGNRVIVTGRDEHKLAALRAEAPAIETITADMADPAAVERLAAASSDVTVLVNNAAVQHNYDFGDMSVPTEWLPTLTPAMWRMPFVRISSTTQALGHGRLLGYD